MKTDFLYISDIHINYWISNDGLNETKDKKYIKEKTNIFFEKINKNPEVENLIIGGDIGFFIDQNIAFLELIKEETNIKRIFIVYGNHDRIKSKYNSAYNNFIDVENKMTEDYMNAEINVLNGGVFLINGIKLGGTGMWYQGEMYDEKEIKNLSKKFNSNLVLELAKTCNLSEKKILNLWKDTNDGKHLFPFIDTFKDIYEAERNKIEIISRDSDIIVTHVPPIYVLSEWSINHNVNNVLFHFFKGDKLINKTSAKYWLSGHVHEKHKFNVKGTTLIVNPVGKPKENKKIKFEKITIKNDFHL